MLIIDVHTHFAPASVLAAARRGQGFDGMTTEHTGGQEWLVHRQGFHWPVPPVFYDLPARLAVMDQRGIGHAVVSAALAELRRAVLGLGMRGAEIGPDVADQLAGTGLAPADTELIAGRNAAALFGVAELW